MQKNVISESTGLYTSPIVIIKKKNNEKRICVDDRRLNTQTIKDFYPLPRIDDTLGYLTDMKWFTTLDLKYGYWQITVHDADKYKTGFCITDGTYQFNVIPFGLCNAPATFQRTMNHHILSKHNFKFALVYLDDIIIYSKTEK